MNSAEHADKSEIFPVLSQQRNNHHPMSFHEAAMNGHLEKVKEWLAQSANIQQRDKEGQTALHLAAAGGHLEIVKELLEHSADVDRGDREKKTPLHLAVKYGQLEIAKELLKHGANPQLQNEYGQTALHSGIESLEVVKELLKHSTNLQQPDGQGYTADQRARTLELARYLKLCSLEMTKEYCEPATPVVWKANFSLFLSNSTQLQKTSATNNLQEIRDLKLLSYTP